MPQLARLPARIAASSRSDAVGNTEAASNEMSVMTSTRPAVVPCAPALAPGPPWPASPQRMLAPAPRRSSRPGRSCVCAMLYGAAEMILEASIRTFELDRVKVSLTRLGVTRLHISEAERPGVQGAAAFLPRI